MAGSYHRHVSDDDETPSRGIQSVEIAVAVLRAMERRSGPLSLSEIAALAGMQPNKVHRYLVSLVRTGLLSQSTRSARYDFGAGMRRLGAEALRRTDEVVLVSEHLPDLRDLTGHSINLVAWGDTGPVAVRWDYGSHALPITVRVGATLPILTSSVGHVYLTHLPESLTRPVIRAQPGPPPQDGEIEQITTQVRRAGVAITTDAVIPGLTAVAAPIFGSGESLPLAVSVLLPTPQASTETLDEITTTLLDATRKMSIELGAAPPQSGRER